MGANLFDHVESIRISEKKIDYRKPELPLARRLNAIAAIINEHYFVARRFKHQPQRITD